VQTNVKA
jgi:hypothetical protein